MLPPAVELAFRLILQAVVNALVDAMIRTLCWDATNCGVFCHQRWAWHIKAWARVEPCVARMIDTLWPEASATSLAAFDGGVPLILLVIDAGHRSGSIKTTVDAIPSVSVPAKRLDT